MIFYAGTDTWVYILFGVLWVAYAIYKGSNKAADAVKAKSGAERETEKEPSSAASSGLEAIMGSFLTEEDVAEDISETPKEEVVEKPVAKPEKPAVFKEDVPVTTHCEEMTEPSCKPKKRKINIKKAVIYSEILHRPYE